MNADKIKNIVMKPHRGFELIGVYRRTPQGGIEKNSSAVQSLLALTVLLFAAQISVHAQQYPAKPIKVIVGFAAGGASDVTARILAPKLTAMLGPWVLVVNPSVPARTAQELFALARAHPGKLNYASSGIGSSAHITTELFSSMAHIKLVHIPYKGVSDGVTATAIGQADMIFASYPAAQPLLQIAKVRPLAVSIAKRWVMMPSIPTLDEAGLKGFDRSGWYGMLAPAGTPREIVTRLNTAIGSIVNTPEMSDALRKQGLEPGTSTPEEFGAFIRNEVAQNMHIAKAAGINVE